MDVSSLQFPPVTKTLLLGLACVTLPCLIQVQLVNNFTLNWTKVLYSIQLWRPITAFLYGGKKLQLLFDTFSLYQTSLALEKSHFNDTAAYAWEVTVVALFILTFNTLPFLRFSLFFRPLLTALVYLWSRQNSTTKISLFGLVKLPARIYPLVMIFIDLLSYGRGGMVAGIMGLLAGHLWWFVSTYLPLNAPVQHRKHNPISVPMWFRRLFSHGAQPPSVAPMSAVRTTDYRPASAARSAASEAARHRWGSGNKLGTE